MALTIEELQKQLADEKQKNQKLTGDLADKEQALKEAKELAEEQAKALINSKQTGVTSAPVPGKVKVTLKDADGKKVVKTVKFRNGRLRVALADGRQVPSELFLKLANGKKLTREDLDAAPPLIGITKEQALDRITDLVAMGASMLVEA
ncbi:MAG: hypothetical protein AAF828_01545 [Bacteroidota bacterium]